MLEPAGPQWCARFPGSVSIDDLESDFRASVAAFTAALRAAGAVLSIGATYRPPERAYLMHFCCQIAGYRDRKGTYHQISPTDAPAMPGVEIDWTCGGNVERARSAAMAMKQGYLIAYPAALHSRHTERLAIDMSISWYNNLAIRGSSGAITVIASDPKSGTNTELALVGKTYGVIKLATDPPHWSSDGH